MKSFRSLSLRFFAQPRIRLLVVATLYAVVAAGPCLEPVSAQGSGQDTLTFRGVVPQAVLDGTAKPVGHLAPIQMLRVVVGLQPPHLAEEEAFLKELQTKSSPEFHKFLTAEQWNTRFAPTAEDEQAVVDWAQSQGLKVTQRYANRLIVDFEAPATTIETAFGVTLNEYQIGTYIYFSNDREPVIPSSLSGIIHSVQGLNNIQVLRPASGGTQSNAPPGPIYVPGPVKSAPGGTHRDAKGGKLTKGQDGPTPSRTNGYYDPTDLWNSNAYDTTALYNMGHCCNPLNNPGASPPASSIAIATSGAYNPSDLLGFVDQYSLALNAFPYYIDGTPSCCGEETTLDVEWSTAMSNSRSLYQDTAEVFAYEGVNASFGTFTDIYNYILSDGLAGVMSTSWGCAELDCYDSGTMDTHHAIFNQMVGQGWTLVAASGDNGATAAIPSSPGSAVFTCDTRDRVLFPASDPDVVAVGGTTLYLYSDGSYFSETGWMGGTAAGSCAANDGGSGGGCSSYYGRPSYQPNTGCPNGSGGYNRSVPDIALNAWAGQNIYFGGSLIGAGGTSIAAPEIAGFFAQEDAYLLSEGPICGTGSQFCAPAGNGNYGLYYGRLAYETPAPHYPFYDITSGCNSNDITAEYGLGYYCAGPGYDMVTGWGSVNMLQLAWDFNWGIVPGNSLPTVTFSGPAINQWYSTTQDVFWTISAPSRNTYASDGVAGYSAAWDTDPGDPTTEATPGSCSSFYSGNPFYCGPQYPNATGGFLALSSDQGWHTANVRAWGNAGEGSGDVTYGPLGYDTIWPVTTASLSGTLSGSTYVSPVKVTLSASDPGYPSTGSGVAQTVYQVNSGTLTTYAGPFTVSSGGVDTVTFYSTDVAGNVENPVSAHFSIRTGTTTSVSSSANPSSSGKSLTLTATITPTLSGIPKGGTVTFKDGSTVLATHANDDGKATLVISTLPAGSNSITAVYSGSTYFTGSTSSPLMELIINSTTTTLTSSANPSEYGQTVNFTATITSSGSGTPTGTVTFKNGSVTMGTGTVSGGKATLATSSLTVSTSHAITAVYSGDSNFAGSTSAVVKQQVTKAGTSTTVKSSANPSTSGQSVKFTATVISSTTGTPAGTVHFMDGTTTLGSTSLSGGTAIFTTSKLASGTHSITAVYAGNADYTSSTSAVLSQKVNP